MARGDRLGFQSRTQNVVSSAELLRGFGANHHYPAEPADPAFATEVLNFDAINLVSQSSSLLSANPHVPPSESSFVPIQSTEHVRAVQNSQSFAHGLALLEATDPSRKRTISTATARAIETDRAPKTQKTSPSQPESMDQQAASNVSYNINGTDLIQSRSPWFEFAQEPSFFETELASFDGGNNGQPHPPLHTRTSLTGYIPSPLARNGFRQSRSSSYSSAHPSLSSFGLDQPMKAESSQSSAVPSRPHSPESFFTESDADVDWDASPSRRNSHSIHPERTEESPSRPSHRSMPSADIPNISNLVPLHLKAEMDKIFDAYLQAVCSDCMLIHPLFSTTSSQTALL